MWFFYFYMIPTLFCWVFMLINMNGIIVDDEKYSPSSFLLMIIPVLNIVVMFSALIFIFAPVYRYFYRLFTRTDKYGQKVPTKKEKIENELDKYKLRDIERYLRKKKLDKLKRN